MPQKENRPFFKYNTDELEQAISENKNESAQLASIRAEVAHRNPKAQERLNRALEREELGTKNSTSKSFNGALVLKEIRDQKISIQDLIGCDFDDGNSDEPRRITKASTNSRGDFFSTSDDPELISIGSLAQGGVEVPFEMRSLLEKLQHALESKQNAQGRQQDAPRVSKSDKPEIKKSLQSRSIEHLYHFTPYRNLSSILTEGIRPRKELEKRAARGGASPHFPDRRRLDHRRDCVSVSVSFPNSKTFYKKREDSNRMWWVVLRIDASLLANGRCLFFPDNAANANFRGGKNEDRQKWTSSSAFECLFSDKERPTDLAPKFPTNEQAEVQVEGRIAVEMIQAVVFENDAEKVQFLRSSPAAPSHMQFTVEPELFRKRWHYVKNHDVPF